MALINNYTGDDLDGYVGDQLVGVNNTVYNNKNTESEAQTQSVNYLPKGYNMIYNNGLTQIRWK